MESTHKTQRGQTTFVGVGPGDPRLLTLRAVDAIRQAQSIYHAGPDDREGMAYQTVQSFLVADQQVSSINIVMVPGRDNWRERYASAVERIAADHFGGLRVAFITEGDPCLYSTASYLWTLLRERHPDIPFEIVPGVSSISAAAAIAGVPLAQKDDCLAVVPAAYGLNALADAAERFETVAVMKPSADWHAVLDLLESKKELIYVEAVTTNQEFVTTDRAAMRQRQPGYFSLLLAKNGEVVTGGPERAEAKKTKRAGLWIVGIGPGDLRQLTLAARGALREAEIVVGYHAYLDLLKPLGLKAELMGRPIGEEAERAELALELARQGRRVALVSSGDAGIYGMASVLLESIGHDRGIEIEILPGVTAASAAASLLGAPLGHDFACISLSDLLTPWEVIERRLDAAGRADFVIAIYNPVSSRRTWQLPRACEILLRHRRPPTAVGLVDQAYRSGQRLCQMTLEDLAGGRLPAASAFAPTMTTTIIVGNSQTYFSDGRMITPRVSGRHTLS